MADFHIVTINDAQGAAVLVVVESRFAVFETAEIEPRGSCVIKMDAVPAAASYVINMETYRVSYGENYGVGLISDGLDGCAVFDPDAVMALENYNGSRLDEKRILNAYVACNENRIGIPSTILIAIYFYVLSMCKESTKCQ